MAKMRAVQVKAAKSDWQLVEIDIPEPKPRTVRIKVQACGVCHSDMFTKEGLFPGTQFPRTPGHEVVGIVDKLGEGVQGFKVGDKVGVGWHGGNCGYCDNCRRGYFFACQNESAITGITYDGGYADYMVAPASAVAHLPEGLSPEEAAPLMCAGVTTFNALRNCGARAGELVAVLGLGGLGHLAVQYAAKMGFKTVSIARGKDKGELAKKLGAWKFIDSRSEDPAAELAKLGGAKVIISTVTAEDAVAATLGGLGTAGTLFILGVPQSLTVNPGMLVSGSQSIKGWYSGTSIDSQDTLDFSLLSGVRSMNETYPLEKAAEAYDHMMSGKARFRVVLTTGN
ncbi:MAG: alcohol dehydrogenase [Cyanobacteria bacterium REEB67]|nr:alcohol dehydrogenase [Cyanobacteria bacterium REEB67]